MSYKDIAVGTKNAKFINARFIKSPKAGTPGVECMFEFIENDVPERLSWTGWLTEKALDNTMKTLVDVLGFNGDDSVRQDDAGNTIFASERALNYGCDVKLVIELEASEDGTKHYPRIKWVNSVGGGGFASAEPESVKTDLNALGFKAAFLARKGGGAAPSQDKKPGESYDVEKQNKKLPF